MPRDGVLPFFKQGLHGEHGNRLASQAAGGRQPENNYIPNLTELVRENLSFSNSERLGGFHPASRTGATIFALFASTTGAPFHFPVGNGMDKYQSFAPGITSLGDILEEKGYQNEFLCGSDAGLSGRREDFTQHGSQCH